MYKLLLILFAVCIPHETISDKEIPALSDRN